jgi:hypothetical protein
MKKILLAAALVLPLAACSQTERGAGIGAAVGGAIGGVAGALIGNANEPGRCIYRDRYGRRYTASC